MIKKIKTNKKLLPCPFCGGEPSLEEYSDFLLPYIHKKETVYYVKCRHCGIMTVERFGENAINKSVEVWNERWKE